MQGLLIILLLIVLAAAVLKMYSTVTGIRDDIREFNHDVIELQRSILTSIEKMANSSAADDK